MFSGKTLKNLTAKTNRCDDIKFDNGAVIFSISKTYLLFAKNKD